MRMVSARDILWEPRRRCGCGEIGIRGGLKIHWGFPRCRFESDQPHHFIFTTMYNLELGPFCRSLPLIGVWVTLFFADEI
jgi:hypothetical protein